MPRFFQFLGWAFVIIALLLGIWDLVSWFVLGKFVVPDVGSVWYLAHPDSLLVLEPAISRYLHPYLWNPVIVGILLAPIMLVSLIIGFMILISLKLFGGTRRRTHLSS